MTMNNTENSTALAMLYLCGCALTDTPAEESRLAGVSLGELYKLSSFHSLSALVCRGLEGVSLTSEEDRQHLAAFKTAWQKSVRKNLLLDTERQQLLEFMEQNRIWYVPLKGVVLKDMYPRLGLRQMADNDILFDGERREAVRDWFVSRGYQVKAYGIGNHDVYLKEPIYNYELHVSLYGKLHEPELQEYYSSVKDRLIKDEGNSYGYRFSHEDFYVYFISHGFKHYSKGGTGLRFLTDLYVYLEHREAEIDFPYVERELKELGLLEFEQSCRQLTQAVFDGAAAFDADGLSPELQEMLSYFLSSGTYGTLTHSVQKGVDWHGNLGYLLRRLFPGTRVLQIYHPIFRHRWLMPVGLLYRAYKIATSRLGRAMGEIRVILKSKRG